jgi:hypothetical protein
MEGELQRVNATRFDSYWSLLQADDVVTSRQAGLQAGEKEREKGKGRNRGGSSTALSKTVLRLS